MRFAVLRLASVLVAMLCLPVVAKGQEPVPSFDQLSTRLKLGDTVRVTDADGREVTGTLRELSRASLTIDSDGLRTLKAEAVRIITLKKGHPFLWGIIAGGAVGAAVGFAQLKDCDPDCIGVEPLLFGGIGCGVGAAVAALIPGKQVLVYRSKDPSDSVRFGLAPLVGPRSRGIILRFVF